MFESATSEIKTTKFNKLKNLINEIQYKKHQKSFFPKKLRFINVLPHKEISKMHKCKIR